MDQFQLFKDKGAPIEDQAMSWASYAYQKKVNADGIPSEQVVNLARRKAVEQADGMIN